MLNKTWRNDVYKYCSGIVAANKSKLLAINGIEDHVHLFVGLHPTISVSDLIGKVKSNSTRYINDNFLTDRSFAWQDGYSAFTNSHSQVSSIIQYIERQEAHHKKKTFRSEYMEMLEKYDVLHNNQFLFDFFH